MENINGGSGEDQKITEGLEGAVLKFREREDYPRSLYESPSEMVRFC